MADPNEAFAIPGNLVFTRRRFLRALAPVDGVLGVPVRLAPTGDSCVEIVLKTAKTVILPT